MYRTLIAKDKDKLPELPKLLFGEVVEVNFIFKTSGVRQFIASDVDRTCILLKKVSFVIFFFFGLLDMDFYFLFHLFFRKKNILYTYLLCNTMVINILLLIIKQLVNIKYVYTCYDTYLENICRQSQYYNPIKYIVSNNLH